MKFRQIKSDEWVKGDYRPFAEIKIKSSTIEKTFDVIFKSHFDDGIGETKLAYFITDAETQFFLVECMPNSQNPIIQIFILNNEKSLAEDLDEVLDALELTSKDLTWLDENIKFQPHEL